MRGGEGVNFRGEPKGRIHKKRKILQNKKKKKKKGRTSLKGVRPPPDPQHHEKENYPVDPKGTQGKLITLNSEKRDTASQWGGETGNEWIQRPVGGVQKAGGAEEKQLRAFRRQERKEVAKSPIQSKEQKGR